MQPLFDVLLANEFRSEDEQRVWQCRALTEMLRCAASQVPYYANVLDGLGLSVRHIRTPDDLPHLPILRKLDVISHGEQLRARALPSDDRVTSATRSSGTTGRPVTVFQSGGSSMMFSVLWHRQARWFDLQPEGTLVDVRIAGDISGQNSRSNPDGFVVHRPRWRYLGQFCETGPEYGFNVSNPMEQQVEWLRQYRPDYVMTLPSVLEEWLLANDGRKPVESLKVLIGIASQLTPALRRRLEQAYEIPIHRTYGLNEVGKVALRCEAGRYHVHTEHCLVEVVHPDGQPCAPGQTGHLLVTGFRNHAMPLIRYDTGDLAEVVVGPCACGRTLPSFGEVAGRYRRFAGLPAGTRERVYALLKAFDDVPWNLLAFLRRYQIH